MRKIKLYKNKYISIFILILVLINSKNDIKNIKKKSTPIHFCEKCIFARKRTKLCNKCPIKLIYKSIKIKSTEETLDEIIKNKKSIARFGDGELNIIYNKNIKFQKFNKRLKNKLLEVLHSTMKNLLIGIMKFEDLKHSAFWLKWFEKYKFRFRKLLNPNNIYYNSFITRFITLFKNKIDNKKFIAKFKTIWNNRNILIIEGDKTRVGIGNNLFSNSKSIKRIICPNINAFKVFNKILKYFHNHNIDKDTLILIALGPTATVLAYELCKLGFQSIDIGHLDLQYEYYLKNVTHIIKLPNKYVNEISGGTSNISRVNDKNYYKEILVKLS